MNFSQGHSRTKFNVNRVCFTRGKHQISQKRAKFMNFSFWPFLWFGLPGRLLRKMAQKLQFSPCTPGRPENYRKITEKITKGVIFSNFLYFCVIFFGRFSVIFRTVPGVGQIVIIDYFSRSFGVGGFVFSKGKL